MKFKTGFNKSKIILIYLFTLMRMGVCKKKKKQLNYIIMTLMVFKIFIRFPQNSFDLSTHRSIIHILSRKESLKGGWNSN